MKTITDKESKETINKTVEYLQENKEKIDSIIFASTINRKIKLITNADIDTLAAFFYIMAENDEKIQAIMRTVLKKFEH